MASPSLTVSPISIPVQIPGNNRLKFYSIKIRGFATELRTNLLLYLAHTYLYAYSNVPSKRCFAFTWYCYACMGQTGSLAKWGVSLWPCLEARGLQNLLQPLGQTLLLLSYQRYSMSWLPDGAHMPSLEKPVVHVEMAVSHALCHTMSKDIPSPSKCKPKSFDCYCFPTLFFICSGFSFSVHTKSILKSTQNSVFSFFFSENFHLI